MRIIFRSLSLLLVILILLFSFAACKKNNGDEGSDTVSDHEIFFDLVSASGEAATLVTADRAAVDITAIARQLTSAIKEITGKEPKTIGLSEINEAKGSVILIGNTDHKDSTAFIESLKNMDYGFGVASEKILCIGAPLSSNNIKAAELFMEMLRDGSSLKTEGERRYFSSASCKIHKGDYTITEMTVNSVDIGKFVIVYAPDYEDAAKSLQSRISYSVGKTIELRTHSDAESEYELIVGDINRKELSSHYPVERYSSYLDFKVTVSGKKVLFIANNATSMGAAMNSFFTDVMTNGVTAEKKLEVTDASSVSGRADLPKNLNISSRAEGTEVRIACNNVYFYSENCEPMQKRRFTMCDSIFFMDADVVLLQEVSTKWHTNMDTLMEDMGYTIVPTRLNEGAVIGAAEVSTQTNYTPIWYRDGVLELLDYGYDQFESVKLKPDSNHTTSKGFTWALFRIKATGESFVCVSTHFTWAPANFTPAPDELRLADAAEIVEAIETIQSKYENLPCVVMGDMNSTISSPAYKLLTETLADAKNMAPKQNNTDKGSSHTVGKYPVAGSVIDHTLFTGDTINALQYQFVLNDFSVKSTDHVPLLFDIAIK